MHDDPPECWLSAIVVASLLLLLPLLLLLLGQLLKPSELLPKAR
jgi:hypothetical protein